MRHVRDMESVSDDAEFREWVKANAASCGHDVMAAALAATEEEVRRPKRLQAEFQRKWISMCVAAYTETYSCKKDAAVAQARKQLAVGERTVWNALAPARAAPTWMREKFSALVAYHMELAARRGDWATVRILRRVKPDTCTF